MSNTLAVFHAPMLAMKAVTLANMSLQRAGTAVKARCKGLHFAGRCLNLLSRCTHFAGTLQRAAGNLQRAALTCHAVAGTSQALCRHSAGTLQACAGTLQACAGTLQALCRVLKALCRRSPHARHRRDVPCDVFDEKQLGVEHELPLEILSYNPQRCSWRLCVRAVMKSALRMASNSCCRPMEPWCTNSAMGMSSWTSTATAWAIA
jgi:hypothetical protein